jgi:hypothetical protein
VRRAVDNASGLLSDDHVRSDDWFELGERLRRACWQLGSATHCLREWAAPDEQRPDTDGYVEPDDEKLSTPERSQRRSRRAGRRNTRNWDAAT